MRFDHEYVSGLLAPAGFTFRFLDKQISELRVARKASSEIFEQVKIDEGWETDFPGYVIAGGVICTIVPGATVLKGMGEYMSLPEIAGEQGWTRIANNDEFRAWADRLAAIAPERAAQLSERVGPKLLADTRQAREAVVRYYARCCEYDTMQEAKAALQSRATAEQLNAVRTMLRRPAVFVEDGLIYYEVAALAMILFAKELDEYSAWLALPDPEQDRQIVIRLQILASRLAREPGW